MIWLMRIKRDVKIARTPKRFVVSGRMHLTQSSKAAKQQRPTTIHPISLRVFAPCRLCAFAPLR
jgi:hypothetical protein